jgi:hypothetical protein
LEVHIGAIGAFPPASTYAVAFVGVTGEEPV